MRLKTIISLFVGLAIVAAAAEAAPKKKKKRKKRKKKADSAEMADSGSGYSAPYGMAGCGLGSLFFGKDNSMVMQLVAATLNGTGVQTSGITSGTSNCVNTPSSAIANQEREVYVRVNFNSLTKEAAQGEGQHLRAFADILGCASGDTYSRFTDLTMSNYESIFNSEQPDQVLSNYMGVLRGDEQLSTSCERLGA